jgi:hypothetical protein
MKKTGSIRKIVQVAAVGFRTFILTEILNREFFTGQYEATG